MVDDKLKLPAHGETVGILICGSKNEHTVRYALGRADSPMAVSTYTYETLPAEERDALPAAEELSAAFDQVESPTDQPK
ncbi:PDDEXK nuclease domain-containing protein [Arthrobacter sp. A5]|uniref:PDDEXK nuclease domain-containing protein n=1 Tax=Arthrobacter sp. A5 TaxID=576926 RepID=UPI003DA9DBEC